MGFNSGRKILICHFYEIIYPNSMTFSRKKYEKLLQLVIELCLNNSQNLIKDIKN